MLQLQHYLDKLPQLHAVLTYLVVILKKILEIAALRFHNLRGNTHTILPLILLGPVFVVMANRVDMLHGDVVVETKLEDVLHLRLKS